MADNDKSVDKSKPGSGESKPPDPDGKPPRERRLPGDTRNTTPTKPDPNKGDTGNTTPTKPRS